VAYVQNRVVCDTITAFENKMEIEKRQMVGATSDLSDKIQSLGFIKFTLLDL
jgi:hypothetical protein